MLNKITAKTAIGIIAILLLAMPVLALSAGVAVDGDITLSETDGPEVTISDADDLGLSGPNPDGVEFQTSEGSVLFESDGKTQSHLSAQDIGVESNSVSQIETNGNDLTITFEGKSGVTVSKGIDSITWDGTASVDSNETAFDYTASSTASVNIRTDANDGDKLVAIDESDDIIDSAFVNGSDITLSNLDAGTSSISLETAVDPDISDPDPEDGAAVSDSDITLSVSISDENFDEFNDHTVEVEFFDENGESIGSETLTDEGRASVSYNNPTAGTNEWSVVATDKFGKTDEASFSFETPNTLTIRDITDQSVVDDESDVDIEFIGDDGTVVEKTTDNGIVDMTGLVVDERFAATVQASNYSSRQAIVPSILEQQTIYLIPDDGTVDTVENRFSLTDPTNQFNEQESEIMIKRPIEIDGSTEFVAVAGDRFGINGFSTILERDQRYRINVFDPESGAERELGEFTPTQPEEITLQVEDVEFTVPDEQTDGFRFGAEYLDAEDGNNDEIRVEVDDDRGIESGEIVIHERGNESNVLFSQTIDSGFVTTETVPDDESNKNWNVKVDVVTENGEEISVNRFVGPESIPVGDQIPQHWQTAFSFVLLTMMGGLFGAVNPGIGGISVSVTGGIMWMVGWLPGQTTGLMVILALFVSILAYAARRAR